MPKVFYSNGKLLLTGEYAILDGAKGLAVPTKFGQSLEIASNKEAILSWKSIDYLGETWFSAKFNPKDVSLYSSSDATIATTLQQILLGAKKLNSKFLNEELGIAVETKLTFPRNWGLGTSSTLINNIAQWAQVNAHQLLWNSFGGSGYDISCAQYNTPIIYRIENKLPKVDPIHFNPKFKNQIYFVHLNHKQNSKTAITNYRSKVFDTKKLILEINKLTTAIVDAKNLLEFENLIEKHEATLARILEVPPIKEKLFSDYFGSIKSLGGWGGDFIMATGNEKTPEYFKSKGFDTILNFKEMLL